MTSPTPTPAPTPKEKELQLVKSCFLYEKENKALIENYVLVKKANATIYEEPSLLMCLKAYIEEHVKRDDNIPSRSRAVTKGQRRFTY